MRTITEVRYFDFDKILAVGRNWAQIREAIRREVVYEAICGNSVCCRINAESLAHIGPNLPTTVVMIIQADNDGFTPTDRVQPWLVQGLVYQKVLDMIANDDDGLLPVVGKDGLLAVTVGEREVVLLVPLVLNQDMTENNKTARQYACHIKAYLEKDLDFTLTLAIGRQCSDYTGLRQSYKDAVRALEHKFYLGNSSVIHWQDFKWSENEHQAIFIEHEAEVLAALRNSEWTKVTNLILALLSHIARQGKIRPKILKIRVLELLTVISRAAIELGANSDVLLDLKVKAGEEIEPVATIQEMMDWLLSIIDKICDLLKERQQANAARAVAKAKQYIESHDYQDICLEELARQVYLSPYYLSREFTEQTGVSFTDYLKAVRIRKAQSLLMTTNRPVADVAASVGYSDPNYFSRVFKAVTGKTPQQYRQGKKQLKA